MKKEIFTHIAKIKSQIKGLETALGKFTIQALKEMKDADMDSIELTGANDEVLGTFSRFERSYWSYTDETKITIDTSRIKAQHDGTANEVISESLTYRAVKLQSNSDNETL